MADITKNTTIGEALRINPDRARVDGDRDALSRLSFRAGRNTGGGGYGAWHRRRGSDGEDRSGINAADGD